MQIRFKIDVEIEDIIGRELAEFRDKMREVEEGILNTAPRMLGGYEPKRIMVSGEIVAPGTEEKKPFLKPSPPFLIGSSTLKFLEDKEFRFQHENYPYLDFERYSLSDFKEALTWVDPENEDGGYFYGTFSHFADEDSPCELLVESHKSASPVDILDFFDRAKGIFRQDAPLREIIEASKYLWCWFGDGPRKLYKPGGDWNYVRDGLESDAVDLVEEVERSPCLVSDQYKDLPRNLWRESVSNGTTCLSYWEWVIDLQDKRNLRL